MKSAVYTKAGQVGLAEIVRPQIEAPDDAIIRIVRTCVCGSDLWSYRNPEMEEGHRNSGHEAIGIVEEVGEEVTTVKPGDFVIAALYYARQDHRETSVADIVKPGGQPLLG